MLVGNGKNVFLFVLVARCFTAESYRLKTLAEQRLDQYVDRLSKHDQDLVQFSGNGQNRSNSSFCSWQKLLQMSDCKRMCEQQEELDGFHTLSNILNHHTDDLHSKLEEAQAKLEKKKEDAKYPWNCNLELKSAKPCDWSHAPVRRGQRCKQQLWNDDLWGPEAEKRCTEDRWCLGLMKRNRDDYNSDLNWTQILMPRAFTFTPDGCTWATAHMQKGQRCTEELWNGDMLRVDAEKRCFQDPSCRGLMFQNLDGGDGRHVEFGWYQGCGGSTVGKKDSGWDLIMKPGTWAFAKIEEGQRCSNELWNGDMLRVDAEKRCFDDASCLGLMFRNSDGDDGRQVEFGWYQGCGGSTAGKKNSGWDIIHKPKGCWYQGCGDSLHGEANPGWDLITKPGECQRPPPISDGCTWKTSIMKRGHRCKEEIWSQEVMSRIDAETRCSNEQSCLGLMFMNIDGGDGRDTDSGWYQGCGGSTYGHDDPGWDVIVKPVECQTEGYGNIGMGFCGNRCSWAETRMRKGQRCKKQLWNENGMSRIAAEEKCATDPLCLGLMFQNLDGGDGRTVEFGWYQGCGESTEGSKNSGWDLLLRPDSWASARIKRKERCTKELWNGPTMSRIDAEQKCFDDVSCLGLMFRNSDGDDGRDVESGWYQGCGGKTEGNQDGGWDIIIKPEIGPGECSGNERLNQIASCKTLGECQNECAGTCAGIAFSSTPDSECGRRGLTSCIIYTGDAEVTTASGNLAYTCYKPGAESILDDSSTVEDRPDCTEAQIVAQKREFRDIVGNLPQQSAEADFILDGLSKKLARLKHNLANVECPHHNFAKAVKVVLDVHDMLNNFQFLVGKKIAEGWEKLGGIRCKVMDLMIFGFSIALDKALLWALSGTGVGVALAAIQALPPCHIDLKQAMKEPKQFIANLWQNNHTVLYKLLLKGAQIAGTAAMNLLTNDPNLKEAVADSQTGGYNSSLAPVSFMQIGNSSVNSSLVDNGALTIYGAKQDGHLGRYLGGSLTLRNDADQVLDMFAYGVQFLMLGLTLACGKVGAAIMILVKPLIMCNLHWNADKSACQKNGCYF